MKPILATAIFLLAMTGMAAAADYYAPSALGPYSWIGPYVGANAGYQWGWVSNSPIQPSGVAGGLEAGYNWQRGQFVFGAETDIELSNSLGRTRLWPRFNSPVPGSEPCAAGVASPWATF
jgi:outer membrane immunogenic protein